MLVVLLVSADWELILAGHQVVEDLHATGRVAHAFITLMFGPCKRPSCKEKTRALIPSTATGGINATPLHIAWSPSAARQCFQSAGSSLYHHLCDTSSPALPYSPESGSRSLAEMDVEAHESAAGSCRPSHVQSALSMLSPAIQDEMDISPSQSHHALQARPQLPSCKRQLFKG